MVRHINKIKQYKLLILFLFVPTLPRARTPFCSRMFHEVTADDHFSQSHSKPVPSMGRLEREADVEVLVRVSSQAKNDCFALHRQR